MYLRPIIGGHDNDVVPIIILCPPGRLQVIKYMSEIIETILLESLSNDPIKWRENDPFCDDTPLLSYTPFLPPTTTLRDTETSFYNDPNIQQG